MRITFILPPVGMSGGIKVVAIYAKALKDMGHTVHLISSRHKTISTIRKLRSWLRGRGWPSSIAPTSHLDSIDVHHRVLDHFRPVTDNDVPDGDVVIATWWRTAEWVGSLGPNKGAKVYFIQGHEIFPHVPVDRCHATYRLPFHKIVVARWLKEVMSKEYGDNVVDVVPNSVDRTQFFASIRRKQPVPTIGFLYSDTSLKGVDVTISAIRIVRKHFPNLRIISFGSRRPDPNLRLPEGTEFFHSPPQHQIRDLYSTCDVWITASRSEGFNLPAMEAMACRTPVVSTRTGWPEDAIMTGKNGVLVEIDDVNELAQGVDWVLSRTDGEWKELSSNAFDTASIGSWNESAKLFETALARACQRSARGEI